jgi:aromatic ring-cleaving dioxygenase
MSELTTGSPQVHGYHAHVYYDKETLPAATRLREKLAASFPVKAGRLSDEPIGPHPVSQFAVIFEPDAFHTVIPWLMLNREGLDVLVHPLTDDMVDDHSVYALWLGQPVKLKLETMQRRGYSAALLPAA